MCFGESKVWYPWAANCSGGFRWLEYSTSIILARQKHGLLGTVDLSHFSDDRRFNNLCLTRFT